MKHLQFKNMKIEIGKYVKVINNTDDTFDFKYLGMIGLVIGHNENNMTGNTFIDPLHLVQFDNIIESFWFEELELLNENK